MKVSVKTLDGGAAGEIDLDDSVFGLEPREDILQRVVKWQLSRRQTGNHKTKTRREIQGTGKKMYRQKGTGGARHGDKKVPQFRGGGKPFGPLVRDHATDLPKRVRALGLKLALSAKAKSESLIIIDTATSDDGKTKGLKAKLDGLNLGRTLIVDGEIEEKFGLAARNIENVDVLPAVGANVYDILRRDTLVLTKNAVDALQERFK